MTPFEEAQYDIIVSILLQMLRPQTATQTCITRNSNLGGEVINAPSLPLGISTRYKQYLMNLFKQIYGMPYSLCSRALSWVLNLGLCFSKSSFVLVQAQFANCLRLYIKFSKELIMLWFYRIFPWSCKMML